MNLEQLHDITGVLVNIAVLLGALVAVVKFRVFNVLGHRWRSEVECAHWQLDDGSIIFTADYTVHNTGQRTLQIQNVSMRLVAAGAEGPLLVPDESRIIAAREMQSGDPNLKGIFHIEAGERTIFTLRCRLSQLDDAVFILCRFNLGYKRAPAGFRGFYCHKASNPEQAAPLQIRGKDTSGSELSLAS